MKVQALARRRRESRRGKRFYTARDMAILKLDQSIVNSRVKRGEGKYGTWYVCGCGAEGCFVLSHPSVNKSLYGRSHLKRRDLQRFKGDSSTYDFKYTMGEGARDAYGVGTMCRAPRGPNERTYPSAANVEIDKKRS